MVLGVGVSFTVSRLGTLMSAQGIFIYIYMYVCLSLSIPNVVIKVRS